MEHLEYVNHSKLLKFDTGIDYLSSSYMRILLGCILKYMNNFFSKFARARLNVERTLNVVIIYYYSIIV